MYTAYQLSILNLHLALDTCLRCGPIFNTVSPHFIPCPLSAYHSLRFIVFVRENITLRPIYMHGIWKDRDFR